MLLRSLSIFTLVQQTPLAQSVYLYLLQHLQTGNILREREST